MENINVNKFRDNLKTFVDLAVSRHEPIRVTRRNGDDFIVMSASDWESEQETLYILQDPYLMEKIRAARRNNEQKTGYRPTSQEMSEFLSIQSGQVAESTDTIAAKPAGLQHSETNG